MNGNGKNSRGLFRSALLPLSVIFAIAGVSGIAIATTSTVGIENMNEAVEGSRGSERVGALVAVPTVVGKSNGQSEWGVLTYTSNQGGACLVAGPEVNGHIGSYGPGGFRTYVADEGPGSCGDVRANFRDLGGIALAQQSPADTEGKVLAGVVYGLVGPGTKAVLIRSSTESEHAVETTPLKSGPQGAVASFAYPLPAVANSEHASTSEMRGVVVTFVKADGGRAEIPFD